jgi:hypothetical protein
MTAKIQVRRDTTANWAAASSNILAPGEIALDTDLNQIKIGSNIAYGSTPYLGATLPSFATALTDLNDSSFRVMGLYSFASAVGLTNGPAAPTVLVAADGHAVLLVVKQSTYVTQTLWTYGTVSPFTPSKSYCRQYNGSAWNAWAPQSVWGADATNGVDLIAKSLRAKDTLIVDGVSALVGNVIVAGTTTLGDTDADVVTVRAGAVGAPIITTAGDLNTGIFFPAADKLAFTGGGTQQLLLDSTAAAVLKAVFVGGATFNGNLDLNSLGRVRNATAPTAAADVLRAQELYDGFALGWATTNATTITASTGTLQWTTTGIGTPTVTLKPTAGGTSWAGIVIAYLSTAGGVGGVTVTPYTGTLISSSSACTVSASGNTGGIVFMLYRVY